MSKAEYFRQQARECRAIAEQSQNREEKRGLLFLARHYDTESSRAQNGTGSYGEAHASWRDRYCAT
jgi:hypothetical protein